MKLNRALVGCALGAATLASPAAFAGATGNVGAFSEYMFRGVAQEGGAAVQGGLDYAHGSGLYVGTWASNIGFAGGTEMDLYVGYAGKAGSVGFDLGAIYYWYPEEDETDEEYSTLEFKAGATFGPVSVYYYYSDEANFFAGTGDADEAGYLVGTLSLPIKEGLNVTGNIGYYHGDAVEDYFGEENEDYIDYSVGLAKTLDAGFTATFQMIDTNLEGGGVDDEPKFVVGLKKTFDL